MFGLSIARMRTLIGWPWLIFKGSKIPREFWDGIARSNVCGSLHPQFYLEHVEWCCIYQKAVEVIGLELIAPVHNERVPRIKVKVRGKKAEWVSVYKDKWGRVYIRLLVVPPGKYLSEHLDVILGKI